MTINYIPPAYKLRKKDIWKKYEYIALQSFKEQKMDKLDDWLEKMFINCSNGFMRQSFYTKLERMVREKKKNFEKIKNQEYKIIL